MSFGGTGGRDCRTGLSTCLQCNEYKVSVLEVCLSNYPTKNNNRWAWKCPSCNKASYVDRLLKPENLMFVCSDSEEEESDEDEIGDGEESESKVSADVESEVEVAKQRLSRMALGSPKYGSPNVGSLTYEEKIRKRVIPILTGLAEHENQVNALRLSFGGLIRDVQDFNFENSRGNEEGLSLPARRANARMLQMFRLDREADYLVELQGQFLRMLQDAIGEQSQDVSESRLSLRDD
ncbi:hypothetical protein PENANT_c001G04595 [Penicillium antarcticum]|uniref:Uncharacterized protein n=1 Tax=Penicillium antarcticum TaxID=416450 RepID=A0A1V6QQ85_9EURO|nr:hypothetical protein PENANT_c001G04595 [Penicillium antarcticum]